MLLAQRQVRPFLADCTGQTAAVNQTSEGVSGHAADAQAGYRTAGESGERRVIVLCWAKDMERETRIELATNSLEGCDSTIELLPQTNAQHNCIVSNQDPPESLPRGRNWSPS